MEKELKYSTKPEVGMYAVHRKYNPGSPDMYDHTYKILGHVWNTHTDQLDLLYFPLYTVQEEIIQSLDQIFLGFTRAPSSFEEPYNDQTGEPRFRFFSTKKQLEEFLAHARILFAQGAYVWHQTN